MYGAQAVIWKMWNQQKFENDVEMYGAQAEYRKRFKYLGLRMM